MINFIECCFIIFEVLTAVNMSMLIVYAVTPCGLVGADKRFGGRFCLHVQG